MFLNIDYARRAAAREQISNATHVLPITSIENDDDIDYEQLFVDDDEMITDAIEPSSPVKKVNKPVKRVRFSSQVEENSLTPTLPSRPPSVRPTFEIEFDFDSLVSPSIESPFVTPKPPETISNNWKDAFLNDLHTAKTSKPIVSSILQSETRNHDDDDEEDSLWNFMRESNPELLEKLERTNNEKQKRPDRFSTQKPTVIIKSNSKETPKVVKTVQGPSVPEGGASKPILLSQILFKQPEPANISIVEIRLETDPFNQVHDELLHFLLPCHKALCQQGIWPPEHNFTSTIISLQLIKDIAENRRFICDSDRSEMLKHLMFIYTITSFLYVFAYCSLQTAIRHVENVIVQNMKNVCIDQERGKSLFDLLTKTHQTFENVLHPKVLHIKNMLVDYFEKRRQLIGLRPIPDPKFLILVQYESIDLLRDIERGLSTLIEVRSYVYDKQTNITRDELNDLLAYNNTIIIRTRQILPTVISRPKRLTLVIEYEHGEQTPQWHRFCQQQAISYVAYKTILPSFTAPEDDDDDEEEESKCTEMPKMEPSVDDGSENNTLPTIVLARPLVDNFKLLRTLECRNDLSIITRDYHLLGIPVERQPDILIDWITSMLIFDLNTRLDINMVRQKIQSMTLHSCHIHVAILTSGSIPDFILSTYITPITQLAKQIQENEANIEIQIKSFNSLDEFASHVAELVQQEHAKHSTTCILTPGASWNEKMLLRRCSSLNSASAQLLLQRLKNVDLSTVSLNALINQCSEIPVAYLKLFLSNIHEST